jgi:hypothetical protein
LHDACESLIKSYTEKETNMNVVNQFLLTVLLVCATVLLFGAMVTPTLFGEWLQKIDNARYEFTMGE